MDKEFEILLYGASSFTADFIIPYFENLSVNVGLAARNIQNIRGTNLPKIQCTLVEAALKTQILINCVGPYHLTGEECIKSCGIINCLLTLINGAIDSSAQTISL